MVKNITYGTRLEHIAFREQLAELNLLAIENLWKYAILTTHYYTSDFKTNTSKPKQLRKTEKFNIPRVYTNYGMRSRKYYVPSLFNQLPENLQNLQYLNTVKKELMKWCHGNYI